MTNSKKLYVALGAAMLACSTLALAQGTGRAPIPGQLAQDFVAGRVPRLAEIEEAEKDAAANPTNFAMVRRLGKGYFFQFFGGGNVEAVAKAQATFDKALALKADDPETLAYSGALWVFYAGRQEKDPAKQKETYDKAFALLQKAEKLDPRNGAVSSITAGSYVDLPASYGMAPHVIQMLEGMRRGMGPAWDQFSHHGRQRLLLTLGRAYAQTGNSAKAKQNFDEALAINGESTEARLIRAEQAKLTAP
jgi:tetratricopeptide (TPR) repeat protein